MRLHFWKDRGLAFVASRRGLLGAWRNPLLESVRTGPLPEPHGCIKSRGSRPPVAKKILATVREQYATPCAPGLV